MSKELPPDKREVARSLLLRGSMFVHLDPRVEGVVVPPWLRKQPQLVLQMGLDMVVPIVDLRIDKDGVYGTLSFSRSPFTCIVGWDAIFALAGDDGRGMVWPESMPPEILAEVEREAGRKGPVPLSAVADLEDDYDYDDEDDDDDDAKGRPGNVIRLQPKLSALQGGLSPQSKRAPSEAPAPVSKPTSVPAPAPAPKPQDDGVRERDTLELVDTSDVSDPAESAAAGDAADGDAPMPAKAVKDGSDQDTRKASDKGASAAKSERPAPRPAPSRRPSRGSASAARSDSGMDDSGTDDEDPETPPPRGSHLRLIK